MPENILSRNPDLDLLAPGGHPGAAVPDGADPGAAVGVGAGAGVQDGDRRHPGRAFPEEGAPGGEPAAGGVRPEPAAAFDGPVGSSGPGSGSGRRAAVLAAVRPFARRPGFVLALLFVLFVIVSGFLPSLFTSYKPSATSPTEKLESPSPTHLFGTDELGRDLFSRVIHGSSLTVRATGGSVLIAVVVGLAIGVVAGFFGGWIDGFLMRVVDVLLAIPMLLMALAIVTALGFGLLPVAIAVSVAIIPSFARTTRAEVFRVKGQAYVEAARTGGASWGRVLWKHVLPNSWGPVAVLAVLDFGTAVLTISALSFLGFGAAPPAAEWGTLISNGRNFLITSPWLSLLPGLFVGLVVFSLNHIARTLEEVQR